MIGRKLTARLIADQHLDRKPIERLTLLDVVAPERPDGSAAQVTALAGDLGAGGRRGRRRRRPSRT